MTTIVDVVNKPCYIAKETSVLIPDFSENIWDLAYYTPTAKRMGIFDFQKVPTTYRLLAKEYVYAFLNEFPAVGRKRMKVITAHQKLLALTRFLTWLTNRNIGTLDLVNQQTLNDYLTTLAHQQSNINKATLTIKALYDYRAFVSEPTLDFIPWPGKDAASVTGIRNPYSAENRTSRIPENVSAPLIAWSLFFVQTLADEIITQQTNVKNKETIDPLTSEPWRKRSTYGQVFYEQRDLATACIILILFLTGMRFKEAKSIRRGCVTHIRTTESGVKVYELKGKTYKSVTNPEGKDATWVCVEPVAQAVAVLERLNAGSEYILSAPGQKEKQFFGPSKVSVLCKNFQKRVNRHYTNESRPGFPTDEKGNVHHIHPQMFRRTLAAYIALQPYGIVAGMLQYKHVQVLTFEGYAGTSASGFKLEVEAEKQIAAEDDVLDIYRKATVGDVGAGPAGVAIERNIAKFEGRVLSEKQLKSLATSASITFHKGELSNCFYDPEKSLCRSELVRQIELFDTEPGPVFSACSPARCGCSYIGTEHLPAWTKLIKEIETGVLEVGSPLKEVLLRNLETAKSVKEKLTNNVCCEKGETV